MKTSEERKEEINRQIEDTLSNRQSEKKIFRKNLVKKIKETLSDKNMNQTMLAQKMDVTPQQISKWLSTSAVNENKLPDIISLKKIADTLNVSLDYLCGREEKKDVSIKSFENLLYSIWNQYEYCIDNGIPYQLFKIYYETDDYEEMLESGVNPDSIEEGSNTFDFIAFDINESYVKKFLENFKVIVDLRRKGNITDEQVKSFMLPQINELVSQREQWVKDFRIEPPFKSHPRSDKEIGFKHKD